MRSGDISIQVAGAKAAAVLGNVTTGQIVVPGGLQATLGSAVSAEDRTINPDIERFMAKRMGRKDDRGKSEPSLADISARHDYERDP